jgi:hypothetical protein
MCPISAVSVNVSRTIKSFSSTSKEYFSVYFSPVVQCTLYMCPANDHAIFFPFRHGSCGPQRQKARGSALRKGVFPSLAAGEWRGERGMICTVQCWKLQGACFTGWSGKSCSKITISICCWYIANAFCHKSSMKSSHAWAVQADPLAYLCRQCGDSEIIHQFSTFFIFNPSFHCGTDNVIVQQKGK